MSNETKEMLMMFAWAIALLISTVAVFVFFAWALSVMLGPQFDWLEQHGLRGLWCGKGGCGE